MTNEQRGRVIYCDCHQNQILAVRYGNRIVIKDRRHGVNHVAVIDLDAEMAKAARSCNTDRASNDG